MLTDTIKNLSDADLIQNAISLSKEFYGSRMFTDPKEREKWQNDNIALMRILKCLRDRHGWHLGRDIPTDVLLNEDC